MGEIVRPPEARPPKRAITPGSSKEMNLLTPKIIRIMIYDYISITFEQIREQLYVAQLENHLLMQDRHFYLAAKADIPESRSFDEYFRGYVKISSRDIIDTVVGRGLPGVQLSYINSPPESLPLRPGFYYFLIDTTGPYWARIVGSKEIALVLPPMFTNVRIEILVARPFIPRIYRDCYEALEIILNKFVEEDVWWRCTGSGSMPLYSWNDAVHRGTTVMKIKIERESTKFFDRSVTGLDAGSMIQAFEIIKAINSRTSEQEVYIIIDWENTRLGFFVGNTKLGEIINYMRLAIPPKIFEFLKRYSYPNEWELALNVKPRKPPKMLS